MTIILGCGAATIRGRLVYELRLLTSQIQYVYTASLKWHYVYA